MSVLIVECANEACRKDGAVDKFHNYSGRREWTTGFHIEDDGLARRWAPDDGQNALRCAECGEIGTVITY